MSNDARDEAQLNENILPVNPIIQIEDEQPLVINLDMEALKVIKHLRKYDGKADSWEFLKRLDSDLVSYKITINWIVRNFDRVLEGEAKSWYSSMWPSFELLLIANDDANDVTVWNRMKQSFMSFFDNESLINIHKQSNRKLKFEIGNDPQTYATQKLEMLRYINPLMTEADKVENLTKGLPLSLQLQMVAHDMKTTNDFITTLRKISELLHRNGVTNAKTMSQQPYSLYSAPILAETQINRNSRQYEVRPNSYSQNISQQQSRSNETCRYCHCVGHTRESCNNKQRDLNKGIMLVSRPPRDNDQSRQFVSRQYRDSRYSPPNAYQQRNQSYQNPREFQGQSNYQQGRGNQHRDYSQYPRNYNAYPNQQVQRPGAYQNQSMPSYQSQPNNANQQQRGDNSQYPNQNYQSNGNQQQQFPAQNYNSNSQPNPTFPPLQQSMKVHSLHSFSSEPNCGSGLNAMPEN
jgi:hypothetical protein